MDRPDWDRLKTEKDALEPPAASPADGALYWQRRALWAEHRFDALEEAIEPLQHVWTATFALNLSGDDAVLWEGQTIAGTPARIRVDDIRRIIFGAFGKREGTESLSDEEMAGRSAGLRRRVVIRRP